MFNSTHTLVGLAIAKFGPEKWVSYSTVTAVIASNLPDIDSVAGFWGTAAYLDHHRGITHSLVGVPISCAAACRSDVLLFGKFRQDVRSHTGRDYLASPARLPQSVWSEAVPALEQHVVLRRRGVHHGSIFGSDPLSRISHGVALAAAEILRHICSCRSRRHIHRIPSGTACRGDCASSTSLYRVPRRRREWALLPNMWNPQRWDAILQSDDELFRFDVDVRSRVQVDMPTVRMESASPSEIVNRAQVAPSSAALLRFGRFPVTRVGQSPSGHRVTFLDFRFYREAAGTALASETPIGSITTGDRRKHLFRQPHWKRAFRLSGSSCVP